MYNEKNIPIKKSYVLLRFASFCQFTFLLICLILVSMVSRSKLLVVGRYWT